MVAWTLLFAASVTMFGQKIIERPHKDPATSQMAAGGFWRTDRGFDAFLRIKNVLLTQGLTVTPVIYMADGTEVDLEPTHFDPAGVVSINVRIALRDVGAKAGAHLLSFGSASVKYQWGWPVVIATIQDLDETESIT